MLRQSSVKCAGNLSGYRVYQDLRTADRSVTASAMQVWYADDG
jgi:hypothetical protein